MHTDNKDNRDKSISKTRIEQTESGPIDINSESSPKTKKMQ